MKETIETINLLEYVNHRMMHHAFFSFLFLAALSYQYYYSPTKDDPVILTIGFAAAIYFLITIRFVIQNIKALKRQYSTLRKEQEAATD